MIRRLILLVFILLLTACAAAPIQEMSDARQAINAASQAGNTAHSPPVLYRAKQYLIVAQTALERGEYSTAKKNALKAKQLAVKARLISVNGP